ncbi:MAG: helix-turn-helix transcriptional regulator [Candidatus Shapirobacteria bacterium]|jgi:y4mF family transcriptional regulator
MDPIYDVSIFGNILRQRRNALGYTQAQVAKLCGTGIRFISDLENGKPTIELGKAITVASALGIDLVSQVRG